ncbi:hypothetical protein MASR2M15_26260 [Anaerolineales bacterium]
MWHPEDCFDDSGDKLDETLLQEQQAFETHGQPGLPPAAETNPPPTEAYPRAATGIMRRADILNESRDPSARDEQDKSSAEV